MGKDLSSAQHLKVVQKKKNISSYTNIVLILHDIIISTLFLEYTQSLTTCVTFSSFSYNFYMYCYKLEHTIPGQAKTDWISGLILQLTAVNWLASCLKHIIAFINFYNTMIRQYRRKKKICSVSTAKKDKPLKTISMTKWQHVRLLWQNVILALISSCLSHYIISQLQWKVLTCIKVCKYSGFMSCSLTKTKYKLYISKLHLFYKNLKNRRMLWCKNLIKERNQATCETFSWHFKPRLFFNWVCSHLFVFKKLSML